jgi:hypothetical protein
MPVEVCKTRKTLGCLFLLATFWRGSAVGDFVPGWRLLAVIDECRACLWQVEQARQRVRAIKWPGTDTARQMETGRQARHSDRQWAPPGQCWRPGNPGQEHGTTGNETSRDRSEMGSIFHSSPGHGSCVQPYLPAFPVG